MIQLGSTPSAGPGAAAAASFWAAARQQQQSAWTALGAAGRGGGQALGGSRQASLLPHSVALGVPVMSLQPPANRGPPPSQQQQGMPPPQQQQDGSAVRLTLRPGPGGGEGGTQPLHDLPVATSDAASAPAGLAAPGPPLAAAAAGGAAWFHHALQGHQGQGHLSAADYSWLSRPAGAPAAAAPGVNEVLQGAGCPSPTSHLPSLPSARGFQCSGQGHNGSQGQGQDEGQGQEGGQQGEGRSHGPPSSGEWDPLGQDMELGPGDE
ncbi:hypothetical protein V8C86DRAFT_2682451 [Haematococcus lacustris]